MLANLLVAVSNIPCLYPIYVAMTNKDYLTTAALTFVSGASFTSHLVENHKHGMPGIGFSKTVSYYLNRLDVLGCILVSSRLAYLYWQNHGLNFNLIINNKLTFAIYLLPIIFLRISEYDKYNAALRNRYIITHCIWHISVFTMIGRFLKNFIY